MKKFILCLFPLFLLCLCLVACEAGAPSDTTALPPSSTAESPPSTATVTTTPPSTATVTTEAPVILADPSELVLSLQPGTTIGVRGHTVTFSATITNTSRGVYRYMGCSGNDFVPDIRLYYTDEHGQEHEITSQPISLPSDTVIKEIQSGESGTAIYHFTIPSDAPNGPYSITLSYGEQRKEYTDVLSFVTLKPEPNPAYYYSSLLVGTGNEGIKPIMALNYFNEYRSDGSGLCGDGGGSSYFFSMHPDPSDFPILTLNGELKSALPPYTTLSTLTIRDTEYRKVETDVAWDALHLLPEGEYVVTFYQEYDGSAASTDGFYTVSCYENIFRLIIPPNDSTDTQE